MGVWLVAGSLSELIERTGARSASFATALARLRGLPRSALGMMAAHSGIGIMIVGIVAVTAWRQEIITTMKPGDRLSIAGYSVAFEGEAPRTGPNYTAESGRFRVWSGTREIATLVSERRRFRPGDQTTTEAGIRSLLPGDLYVVMGDAASQGRRVVRLYFNPLVSLIWLGAAIMFCGGALSLSDRRFRIGVPRKQRLAAPHPAQ
jgi:cytochrome c-type biogenesis protein CcmF